MIIKDEFKGFDFPTEKEINEDTRRAKISMTSKAKFKADPAWREAKINTALKTAEAKRKVPLADYENIMREYWDNKQIRPLGFVNAIAERYGVKNGVIETIVGNCHDTMPAVEYNKLRTAYENKYTRSDMQKQIHAQGKRDNIAIGSKISQSKQTLTDEQAIEVYNKCLPWKNKKGAKAFQEQLAKEYGVSANKIRLTSFKHHPVFK